MQPAGDCGTWTRHGYNCLHERILEYIKYGHCAYQDALLEVFIVSDRRARLCAPIYEFMKFGCLFSTKAVMPDSPASEKKARSDQKTLHAPSL